MEFRRRKEWTTNPYLCMPQIYHCNYCTGKAHPPKTEKTHIHTIATMRRRNTWQEKRNWFAIKMKETFIFMGDVWKQRKFTRFLWCVLTVETFYSVFVLSFLFFGRLRCVASARVSLRSSSLKTAFLLVRSLQQTKVNRSKRRKENKNACETWKICWIFYWAYDSDSGRHATTTTLFEDVRWIKSENLHSSINRILDRQEKHCS